MSTAWIQKKKPDFARDLLRDFCLVCKELEIQFQEFDKTGDVDFLAMRDLLGEEMSKGLLWRLKDTAHHLFRSSAQSGAIGAIIDWGIGYIFHEAIKLKEDAYEQVTYAPWFRNMHNQKLGEKEQSFCHELLQVLYQTRESMEREIRRIRFILSQLKGMLPVFLAEHRDSEIMARLLVDRNDLVHEVFRDNYRILVKEMYGDRPEHMYVIAARSLRKGGWVPEGLKAVDQALRLNPESEAAREEQQALAACALTR